MLKGTFLLRKYLFYAEKYQLALARLHAVVRSCSYVVSCYSCIYNQFTVTKHLVTRVAWNIFKEREENLKRNILF